MQVNFTYDAMIPIFRTFINLMKDFAFIICNCVSGSVSTQLMFGELWVFCSAGQSFVVGVVFVQFWVRPIRTVGPLKAHISEDHKNCTYLMIESILHRPIN